MKLMIIDGNSIANRAFYGIRSLTNQDGLPTNAVYGFLNIMFKYIQDENPDYLCAAFDLKDKTFRKEKYEDYKAQRKAMPDELVIQMPLIKEALKYLNIKILEIKGFEADDIIGTVSLKCEENKIECAIITGDRDCLQLASKTTKIKLPGLANKKEQEFDIFEFEKQYGIKPINLIDVKALCGDSSDNIKGVKGVGEKSALNLVREYETVENIYNNIDSITTARNLRQLLIDGREKAFESKWLVTIVRNIDLALDFSECALKEPDYPNLINFFEKLNFKSFIAKYKSRKNEQISFETMSAAGGQISMDTALTMPEIELAAEIKPAGELIYYLEEDFLYFVEKGKYKKLPFEKVPMDIFGDGNILKISHDIKKDLNRFDKFEGIGFDICLAAYVLNPGQKTYAISELCRQYLGGVYPNIIALFKLYNIFKDKIKEQNIEKSYYNVELPLIKILYDMQKQGFMVDKTELLDLSKRFGETLLRLEQEIFNISGEQFNINSSKQLGVILFEKLEIPVVKKTKTGYSTDIEVLEKIDHPIAEKLIEYRQISKLKSTYADGLYNAAVNSKIHSNFNQMITATGRLSSTEPNLQNIPVKTELGREIRRVFKASDGFVLIDADYSQIELRVLAHLSKDKAMIKAFIDNLDIHTTTASEVFHVEPKLVTSAMRNMAKAVNFGIIYGMGDFKLAKDLKIPRKEAKLYIEKYFKLYKDIKDYFTSVIKDAAEYGYVTTILNRRRYIPEINSSNKILKAAAERIARNTAIQGSAADIIKMAMVNVFNKLKDYKAKLILQVHDELLIEAPESEAEEIKSLLKTEMENAIKLEVPLVVQINTGEKWTK